MPDYHLVAANLIEEDGEYLLVQEGKEHVRGKWNVPAGSIEEKEEAKKAAVREAKEEAGVEVEIKGLTGVFFDKSDYLDGTVVIIVFNSSISETDFNLKPQRDEEILDAEFYTKEEIRELEIRTPFVLDAIRNLEEGKTAEPEAVKDYR